jgi:O-antigen ligase
MSRRSAIQLAVLIVQALALVWTAFRSAGVNRADWEITALVLSVLAGLVLSSSNSPRLDPWLAWPLALGPAWVLLQLIPLPLLVVRWISPARAELASALGGSQWMPLSVSPAATLAGLLRIVPCVLVFLIVRELTLRYSDRWNSWIVVLPIVAVASFEAALALAQWYIGGGEQVASGTFRNRDHFAGFLEMALPFPVMYGCAVWQRGESRVASPLRPALLACGAFAIAALLLLAVIQSLSRMGLVASLFGLGVLATATLPGKVSWISAPALAILCLVLLSPGALILRFADLSTTHRLASQDRVRVWRETLSLIRAYPVAGCGLDAFESAFPRFKRHAPTTVDNFAHNDYLQYMAELGIIGFAIGVTFVARVIAGTAKAASRHTSLAGRTLARASLASLAALLLHSTVDFNTYIPADAFACAWIAAIGVSAIFSSGLQSGRSYQISHFLKGGHRFYVKDVLSLPPVWRLIPGRCRTDCGGHG